jgi:hypothetical protein
MSPSKKRVKRIKVHVPRHNSQRIGPALTAQIEKVANEKRIRTDVRQPTNEVSSTIALAIVRPQSTLPVPCRTDLNTRKVLPSGTRCYLLPVPSGDHSGMLVHSSMFFRIKPLLLIMDHCRRFQVDEGSNLYYDSSPLLEYQKEEKQAVANTAEGLPSSSSNPHPSQRGQVYPMAGHHSTNGMAMSPIVATPTRHGHGIPGQMGGPYHGPQFNAISPAQFYGGGDRGSPMVTRGMGMSMSMGMGMDGMGITPDVRSLSRRM